MPGRNIYKFLITWSSLLRLFKKFFFFLHCTFLKEWPQDSQKTKRIEKRRRRRNNLDRPTDRPTDSLCNAADAVHDVGVGVGDAVINDVRSAWIDDKVSSEWGKGGSGWKKPNRVPPTAVCISLAFDYSSSVGCLNNSSGGGGARIDIELL